MAILRQYGINHYGGLEGEKPVELPYGDTYFAEDTNILYKYNKLKSPIAIGKITEEQNETLSHFKYNPNTDQLEADRTIVTTLNTFSLSNVHDITSIGENVIFRNNASKIIWSPSWGGVREQHIPAYQGKGGVIQPSARQHEDMYTIQQGVSADTVGSTVYESTSTLTSSSGIWSLTAVVAETVLPTDYLFYEIYYGTGDDGIKAYEQILTGTNFNIGASIYSLDPNDGTTPLDRWYFDHQAEFHEGSEMYFRITKSNSRDGDRDLLLVRPSSVNPSTYFVEVSLRDFKDLDLEYISPFLNYEGMDFSTDDTKTNVIFSDYVTKEALRPFFINELKAIDNGNGGIEIYIKDGTKTYTKDLNISKIYIDEVLVTQILATAVNELNALFSNAGTSTGAIPVITSSLALAVTSGDSTSYTLEGDFGSEVIWDFSNVPGITSKNGNNWKFLGGSALAAGSYNVPVLLINSNGQDSKTIVITVANPPYQNTKAIEFDNNDFLTATAETSDPFYRASNGSGVSDAWTIKVSLKGGSNGNSKQTIMSYGGNDENNEGRVWLKWDASGGNKRIVLRFGTKNNHLSLKTPVDSFTKDVRRDIMVTYSGGTTGQSQNDLSDYYSRFNIFINDVNQTLTLDHSNDGWSGSIKAEVFKIGESAFGGHHLRNGTIVDEFGVWSTDETANSVAIYNGGTAHDLALLTSPPVIYIRMGDGDTYPDIKDNIGNKDFTMINMLPVNIVNDVT